MLVLQLHELFLLFFVNTWDVNQEQALEPSPHLLLVTKCIQAHDQVETNVEVGRIVHNILIHLNSLAEALLLDQGQSYILLDFELHFLVLLSGAVNGHVVVLDGHVVLLLLKVDVAHVDTQAGRLWILLVLQNDRVAVNRLSVESICMVHVGEVVEDVEGQVDVDLVEAASLLAQRTNLFLLRCRFFGLLQSIIVVLLNLGGSRLLQQAVDFLFELLEVLLLRLLFLLLDVGLASMGGSDALREWLRLEAGRRVGFHRGAQTLGRAWNGGSTGTDALV